MKAYVYILWFESKDKYYIGSTTDIDRRLKQHKAGNTQTTKRLGGFQLVFCQDLKSLPTARKIERKMKSWKRKDFIEKIVKEGRLKISESS